MDFVAGHYDTVKKILFLIAMHHVLEATVYDGFVGNRFSGIVAPWLSQGVIRR